MCNRQLWNLTNCNTCKQQVSRWLTDFSIIALKMHFGRFFIEKLFKFSRSNFYEHVNNKLNYMQSK